MTVRFSRLRDIGRLAGLSIALLLASLVITSAAAARPAHAISPTVGCCPTQLIYNPTISVAASSVDPFDIRVTGSGFVGGDAVTLKWYRGFRGDTSQPPLKPTVVYASNGAYNAGEIAVELFLNTAQGDPAYHGPTWVLATAAGGPRPVTIWSATVFI